MAVDLRSFSSIYLDVQLCCLRVSCSTLRGGLQAVLGNARYNPASNVWHGLTLSNQSRSALAGVCKAEGQPSLVIRLQMHLLRCQRDRTK
jgi:hypothetical protein